MMVTEITFNSFTRVTQFHHIRLKSSGPVRLQTDVDVWKTTKQEI